MTLTENSRVKQQQPMRLDILRALKIQLCAAFWEIYNQIFSLLSRLGKLLVGSLSWPSKLNF